MAEVGGELGVAGALAGAQEREHDLAVLCRRKQPVAGEGYAQRLGLHLGERLFERAVCGGEIEVVERAGDVEVGICVEPVDEALTLVAEELSTSNCTSKV